MKEIVLLTWALIWSDCLRGLLEHYGEAPFVTNIYPDGEGGIIVEKCISVTERRPDYYSSDGHTNTGMHECTQSAVKLVDYGNRNTE